MSNNSKLKVQLELNDRTAIIDVEPYKKISFLYEKAEAVFYPLSFEAFNKILTFNSKDISSLMNAPVGEIFRNKGRVTLKITDTPVKYTKEVQKNIKNNNYEFFNPEDEYLQSRKIRVKAKEGEDFEVKNNNMSKNVELSMCYCKNKEPITFYCRKCKEFICKSCRFNTEHINHKSIILDINKQMYLEESVSLYCLNIQADAGLCLKAIEGYSNVFKEFKLFDFADKKNKLIDKINYLDTQISSLTSHLPKVESGEVLLSELEATNKTLNTKINKILNEVNQLKNSKLEFSSKLNNSSLNNSRIESQTNKERMEKIEKTEEDTFVLMEEVSNLEFDIENLSQRTLALKLNYDIHNKISEMYDNLIKSFDLNVFNEEYKFSLDFDVKETKFVPNEITSILRQTANSKGNNESMSIQNLIHFGKNLKLEMDEERKQYEENENSNSYKGKKTNKTNNKSNYNNTKLKDKVA